ncbi:3-hydroxyacyl-CoA dehydrogenase [Polaromonas sp. OV174]|uniref:3-hydroxyacyl-CoA dehydrogenase n=1 Tax=Polaromonas sp. OV174 TaxID=1855300 RepID=UPI0008EF8822|nr:3-hydroxyacyl-CoA dehydrogenase [Polaromonas sp. OV174]SFB84675.1 3-hydroxyacyl-CoA dehydrogenase [Polaromonas sp. OV174]
MTGGQLNGVTVLVVGAGIMGVGIAQVAAQAGHAVMLYDLREGAAGEAKTRLASSLNALVLKGKLGADAVAQTLARIEPIDALQAAASAGLVVEAIVEKLDAKRTLFQRLEAVVAADCVLATNTSSISVTAIANGLQHPARLVGMHFFNPVPLMKLVEVVSGLQTDPVVAQAIFELSQAWGKVPVHARSTPGFIVNRIARPFYAETLALLQERAAQPALLDVCLRAAGFRMGPCELIDLIGQDTNFSVTSSVYEANFYDKRFVPSLVQRELVDGGLLGRKSGRGFYDYTAGAASVALPAFEALELGATPPLTTALCVAGRGAVAERLASRLVSAGCAFERDADADWIGLSADGAQLRLTDGRPASQIGAQVAVFDWPLAQQGGAALAWAASSGASPAWLALAPQWLRVLGFSPRQVADTPALVVARTLAMLINEAADAVLQGVCSQDGADAAMKLGVNYPAGPFEWLQDWKRGAVIAVLDALDAHYRGERYRVSPWLRQRTWTEDGT